MSVFRPVLLTATGCLYWTAGLFVAVYSVCHYWISNNPGAQPQYCIWYQQNFAAFQIFLACACLLVSLGCKKDLPGVFLYFMATLGLLFGLLQAPAPEGSDLYFLEPGATLDVKAHIGESVGYKTALITEICTEPKISADCKSSIHQISAKEGRHIAGKATLEGIKDESISNAARCLKNRIFSRLRLEGATEETCPCPEPFFVSIRKLMVAHHAKALGKTRGALLSSIVLGDKVVELPAFVKGRFRRCGVSHLLAASGFNLSIFVGAICLGLRFCTRSIGLIAIAGITAIASFVLLAGSSPSVIRAAIWAALLILLRLTHRQVHMGALFSFSMLIHLALDPFSVLDIGWQLSYVATAGILCGIEHVMSEPKFCFKQWLKSTVIVILVAQAAVLPLACLYFKQINCLFLVSNLALDPFVAPLTILGFASSWICLCSADLAWCLDMLAYYPLEYMLFVTRFISALKFSQFDIAPPPGLILCIYATSFLYLIYVRDKHNQKRFAALVYGLSLALLLLSSICP